MDFEKVEQLIKLVDASSLAFFEIKNENEHIKMDKSLNRSISDNSTKFANCNSIADMPVIKETIEKEKVETQIVEMNELEKSENKTIIEDKNLKVITSPMVGTFYSSASSESEAFVTEGDTINKGKIICIIEAMKLMNEIESDANGVVIGCLAKNGQMVEYGQPLFKVKEE
ncbi:acetyl-CoA carboxylase biotin carboxyl carrier protein [Clostridium saccharoperbutylacetonicum]|uniref:acetyl-CoA carboxylase biotin carboxyl carrier protein n=1 Tax=Clostridium saccharoperbutylacetonicum TaxID=36745 RepID=UPI0039E89842